MFEILSQCNGDTGLYEAAFSPNIPSLENCNSLILVQRDFVGLLWVYFGNKSYQSFLFYGPPKTSWDFRDSIPKCLRVLIIRRANLWE